MVFCRLQADSELTELCINESVICKCKLHWLCCGLSCSIVCSEGHFKNDVDHLKQAIKRVKGMEEKTWCFYTICVSTKNKQKNSTSLPLHPADIFLAVYKTLNFGSTHICDHLKTSQWYSNNVLIVEYLISFHTHYISKGLNGLLIEGLWKCVIQLCNFSDKMWIIK